MELNSQTKTFSYQFVCSLSISEVQSMFGYLVVEIFEIKNFKNVVRPKCLKNEVGPERSLLTFGIAFQDFSRTHGDQLRKKPS